WIDGIRDAGCLIDGFTESVGDGKIQFRPGVPQARFKRVVIRVADASLVVVVMEIRTQRPARAVDHLPRCVCVGQVFRKRSTSRRSRSDCTRIAYSETKRGIA